MLQVYLPYTKDKISQRFGDNATPMYAAQGLKGHTAYDWVVPYGTPIPNCTDNAYCYSLMHLDDPVLMDYRAAFFLVTADDGNMYEISYGHVSKFNCEVGKTYQAGDTIAYVGNTGACYVGQHLVSEAEKDAGSHDGAHLHGPQIRGPLVKSKFTSGEGVTATDFINDAHGLYMTADGYYLGIPNYDNGYHGCLSLATFSTETLATEAHSTPKVPSTATSGVPIVLVPSADAIAMVQTAIPQVQAAVDHLNTIPVEHRGDVISILQKMLEDFAKLLSGHN